MTQLEIAPGPLPQGGQEDTAILEGFRARKPLQCRQMYALVTWALEHCFRLGLCPALGRGELADVAHNILARLLRPTVVFRGSSSLKTWVRAIAHNELVNLLRHERVVREWVCRSPTRPEVTATANETHDCRQVIDRLESILSPAQHEALVLASNHTNEEIASELGVSVATVRSRIAHARRKAKEDPVLAELRSSKAGAGRARKQGDSK